MVWWTRAILVVFFTAHVSQLVDSLLLLLSSPLPSSSSSSLLLLPRRRQQQQQQHPHHNRISLFDHSVRRHTFFARELQGNNGEVLSPDHFDDDNDNVDKNTSKDNIITASSQNDRDELKSIQNPRSSKADLYSNEELMNLFQIHQSLSTTITSTKTNNNNNNLNTNSNTNSANNDDTIPSLQDLIVQTIQDIEQTTTATTATTTSNGASSFHNTKSQKFHTSLTMDELYHKVRQIRAIVSDVDGTLLGSHNHQLHPLTEHAIQNAVEAAFSPIHPLQYFFPATGKTRLGAMHSLGPKVTALLQQCPGVYVQGLYCLDGNGKVIFEKKLSHIVIEQVEAFVSQQQQSQNMTLLAYDGDAIYYNPHQSHVVQHIEDVHQKWGEPSPLPIHSPATTATTSTTTTLLSTYEPAFHKILLMGDDPTVMSNTIRPLLEILVSSLQCVVTQAIPTMLEVLPGGCSKAYGVQKVCDYYGIEVPTQLCTLGDAENDMGMIQMASIGIAMGNAISSLKDVADIVMEDTSTDGAAGQAIELFGLGSILDRME